MKKIISAALLSFCVFTVSAQVTDTSYHLLWYKGKKLKENVLLTTKADTVNYNPAKGVIKVTSKAGRGKQYDNMLKELNRTPQRMQEMTNRVMKGLPKEAMPAILYNVRSAYTEVKDNYTALLDNTVILPEIELPEIVKPVPGRGPSFDFDIEKEYDWEAVKKEFQDFIASHQNKITSVPVPPRLEFAYCNNCDIERKGFYKTEMERFLKELVGEKERAMMTKAFGVSRQAQLLLTKEKADVIQNEVNMIIQFIMDRHWVKINMLIEKYGDDPERCTAVLQAALSTDRQCQLMEFGGAMPEGFIVHAFTTVINYFLKAFDEKNYPVALNLQMILDAERQMQLIGESMPETLVAKAFHFNQFKLNMNISAKVTGDGGYQLAQVKGDNWFSAFPDSTCHLIWVQVGPFINKTKVDLLAAELKGNGGEIPYVGTKIWNSDIPTIKIDFCRRDNLVDSITAYPFHPEGFKELWNMPRMGPMNMALVSNVLVNCFIDVQRARQDAAKFKNAAIVEKLKSEMLAQYQQMMMNYKSGNWAMPERASLNELSSIARGQQNSNKISEIIHSANPGRYIFEPTVHNKEKVVLKERLNGKEIFPANSATEYAFFHLTLEHDPDGPYPFAK